MGRLHNQGTALVGGDASGNTRGDYAVDIQSERNAVTQIASGNYSTAVGYRNTASGVGSTAVGYYCFATEQYSTAIGYHSDAEALYSTAIGYGAEARVQYTVNTGGPLINRKDDGESTDEKFYRYNGVEVVLLSRAVSLKVVADRTITLPSGCKFWLDEVGLIATAVTSLSVQPTIRFGITGDEAKHSAAAITTKITALGKREILTPLVPEDGEVTLTAGVTIAATATLVRGRFYWKGMLIEDQ